MYVYEYFIKFMIAYPKYGITSVLLMCLIPLNDIYLSNKYANLFDSIQKGTFQINEFVVILCIMIILQIGWGIDDIINAKQTPDLQHFCRKQMLTTIFDKLNNDFSDLLTGDLISKIMRAEHILMIWYNRCFSYIIPYIIETLIALYLITKMDVKLGLCFILMLCLFSASMLSSPNECGRKDKTKNINSTSIYEEVDDVLSNYQTIFKKNTLSSEMTRLDTFNESYKEMFFKTISCTTKYRVLQSGLLITFLTYFIYRSFELLKTKQLDNSVFFTALIVVKQIVNNMIHTIDLSRDYTVDWDILMSTNFFTKDLNVRKKANCKNIEMNETILELHNVSFKYEKAKSYILQNINWKINRYDKIALTGNIGSGKSTLLKILLKIYEPESGSVYVNGKCYSNVSIKMVHKFISFMPQNCVLFNRSLIENIQYGNKNKITKDDIIRLLKSNNITTFDNLSNGLDTLCGKNGNNLSGGQRQLVWFIRIYYSESSIVLLDEPTSSLDEKSKEMLLNLINVLLKDKTTIIITHDPYMINKFDNVISIDELNSK